MAGKNYVNVANETLFGQAPSSSWRGLAVEDDGHKARVTTFETKNIVYGQAGPTAKGRRSVTNGGSGTLKSSLVSNGLGQLLAAGFSSATVTTPAGASTARKIVFELTDVASTKSLSVQVQRELKGGTVDHTTYAGGQVTELRLSQGLPPEGGGVTDQGFAKLELDLDYAVVERSTAQILPVYVDPGITFSEAEMLIGPAYDSAGAPSDLDVVLSKRCLNKFDVSLPTGLRLDPDCIGASLTREKASRGSLPEGTLGLGWTPSNAGLYESYLNGEILAFRCHWEPAGTAYEIEAGINPSVTLDVPALQLTGDDPQMSIDQPTTQDLPASILDNGDGVLARLTIITSDTAL